MSVLNVCATPWPPRAPWWFYGTCEVYPRGLPVEVLLEIEEHINWCADLEAIKATMLFPAPPCIGCWGLGVTPFGRCLMCNPACSSPKGN